MVSYIIMESAIPEIEVRRFPSDERGFMKARGTSIDESGKDKHRSFPLSGLPALVILALALFFVSLSFTPITNNDIWLHLAVGEWIVDHGEVPTTDPFSYTASGASFIAHEWLAGVLFYSVYRGAGLSGLMFMKTLFWMAALGLAGWAALRAGGSNVAVLGSLFLAIVIGNGRFLERPEIFTYAITGAYFWVLGEEHRRWRAGAIDTAGGGGRTAASLLWVLVPSQLVWVQTHGAFVTGPILCALFLATTTIESIFVWKKSPGRRRLLTGAFVLASLIAAGLINPNGLHLYETALRLTEGTPELNFEWQPLFESTPALRSSVGITFCFWVALLGAGALFGAVRDSRRTMRSGAIRAALFTILVTGLTMGLARGGDGALILAVLIIAISLALLLRSRRIPFWLLGTTALYFYLAVRYNRNTALFAIGTLPVLALCFTSEERPRAHIRRLMLSIILLLSIAGTILTFTIGWPYAPGIAKKSGLGAGPNIPVKAMDYIEENGISGRVMNSYSYGAYIVFRAYPETQVFIDSRNRIVYPPEIYSRFRTAANDMQTAQELFDEYRPVYAMIQYDRYSFQGHDPAVAFFLSRSPEWALVYFDDRSLVFLNRNAGYADLIAADGFNLLNPVLYQPGTEQAFDLRMRPGYERETARAIARFPESVTAMFLRGEALTGAGEPEEALALLESLLQKDPRHIPAMIAAANRCKRLGLAGEERRWIEEVKSLHGEIEVVRE